MDAIKASLRIVLIADGVEVAESNDQILWGRVLGELVGNPCGLCHQVPRHHCCLRNDHQQNAAQGGGAPNPPLPRDFHADGIERTGAGDPALDTAATDIKGAEQ